MHPLGASHSPEHCWENENCLHGVYSIVQPLVSVLFCHALVSAPDHHLSLQTGAIMASLARFHCVAVTISTCSCHMPKAGHMSSRNATAPTPVFSRLLWQAGNRTWLSTHWLSKSPVQKQRASLLNNSRAEARHTSGFKGGRGTQPALSL